MLEWLKTILGDAYTDDIDKQVSTEIGKGFVARADFNNLNEAKKAVDQTIKDRDAQLEELKKVDPAALQAQIKQLQDDNKAAKAAHDAQLEAIKLDTMLESRLLKEGAVNTKAVKALLDSTKLKLDGDNLLGIDDQLKNLKETEKWAFGYGKPAGRSGGGIGGGTPPGGGEGGTLADEMLSALYGDVSK